jgi:Fe2+ or Zn2+ uptake regulation protein
MTEMTAEQIAQQAAQAAAQASAETVRQVVDASKTARSQEVGAESEFETGTDEGFKNLSQLNGILAQLNYLNGKRTYDEYQHESLRDIRSNATLVNRMATLATDHDGQVRNIAIQALQNAVETANVVGKNVLINLDNVQKQHTAHRDVATDNLWNPIQQGAGDAVTARAVTIDDASLKAIGAAVAAALAAALNPKA